MFRVRDSSNAPWRTWHVCVRARDGDRVCACAPARINAAIGAVGMKRVARARHERGPRDERGGEIRRHSLPRTTGKADDYRSHAGRDVCGSRFRAATRAFPSRREMSNRESSGDCSPPKALSSRHTQPDLLLSLPGVACFFSFFWRAVISFSILTCNVPHMSCD